VWIDMYDDGGAVWASVAEVVDAVEAELDEVVASVEDRVMARMLATSGEPPTAVHDALRRACQLLCATRSPGCAPKPNYPKSCRRT
jgi:hypothetical protein